MLRTILIAATFILCSTTAVSASGQPAANQHRIDACLRHHGWAWGYIALERAEIAHHHPNGLIRVCAGE
jgi:hypothetical protein